MGDTDKTKRLVTESALEEKTLAMSNGITQAVTASDQAATALENLDSTMAEKATGGGEFTTALNAQSAEVADRIAPISALDHGVTWQSLNDGSDAVRGAIIDALTRDPSTLDGNRAVYLPAGHIDIDRPNLFSDFNFTQYGMTPSVRDGLTFRGDGRTSTIVNLRTRGTEKWFYDNGSINNHRFQRLTFEHMKFTTDDPELGNGFKQWSAGAEKQFRFLNCNIEVGVVLQTEGSGNADLNRWEGGSVTAHRALLVLNNPQSVSNGLNGTDVLLYRHGVVIRTGGGFWMNHGNLEMHPTPAGENTPHWLVFAPADPGTGIGNFDHNFSDIRMEVHGPNKGLVNLQGDSNAVTVNFTRFIVAAESGGVRTAVITNGAKRVTFTNSSLLDRLLYESHCANVSAPMGGLITFRDTQTTTHGTPLYTRSKVTGSGRIVADGCFQQGTDRYQEKTPEDFDMGWRNAPPKAILPSVKTLSIKNRNTVLPSTNGNGEWTFTLPTGAYIRRVYIHQPGTGSDPKTYQLHIGTHDKTAILASSPDGTFSQGTTLNVEDVGIVAQGRMRVWATGTLGQINWSGGDAAVAFVEYI